ncbi:MAG: hypothetical protein ABJF90_19905, partial [Lentilitoribacter sp.]
LRLCLGHRREPLNPPIMNDPHVTKQTTVCVLDVLRAARFLPPEIHPSEGLVETRLVLFFDDHLMLTEDGLQGDLHSFSPHALMEPPSCCQEIPVVAVAWIRGNYCVLSSLFCHAASV